MNLVAARSRLPGSVDTSPMPFKIAAFVPPEGAEHLTEDRALPKAQTCFFTLSLPKYSSAKVCLDKLN
jgi:hypothetical protein